MPYIYRYIDLEAREVVYIGKVTKYADIGFDPLRRRHEQHQREDWYLGNAKNIIMQFIELDTPTDADILETWLINKYNTGQLYNKAKIGWGDSKIDLWSCITGRWRTYQKGANQANAAIQEAAFYLNRDSEGLTVNAKQALQAFNDRIREVISENEKAEKLSRYDAQDDFLRVTSKEK